MLLLLLLLKSNITVSAEDIISYESINPKDGISYQVKRIQEKIILFFLSPVLNKKSEKYEEVLNSRLAEVKYVVDNKDLAHIEKTTQRYAATAGEYTDYILSKKMDNKKDKVRQIYVKHQELLEQWNTKFEDTRAEWRFVKDDVNSLESYKQKLN